MVVDNKFEIRQVVYLTTDLEQKPRTVTGLELRDRGVIIYELTCSDSVYGAYDFEISEEKNVLITSDN